MKISRPFRFSALPLGTAMATLMLAGSLQAAVTFTVTDNVPGTSAIDLTTTLGSVSNVPGALPALTYTLTNLDLTSVGGTATNQIVFRINFTKTGGTAVAYNGTGRIAVSGGTDTNQIDPSETLTGTLSLISTDFSGGLTNLSIGFTRINLGGYATNDTNVDIIHDGGTINKDGTGLADVSFDPSSFVTIDTVASADGVNLGAYDIQITAIPEPSAALLGGLGLLALLRRRR